MKNPNEKYIRIFKTFNLYACFFTMGMCLAIPGPCLLDLQEIVNTDTEHIAFIYTGRSIGALIGSILGGILLDKIKYKQAALTFCNFAFSLTIVFIPWSRNLGMLIGCMVLNGLFRGVSDTGANVICLCLWGKNSAPYFQALHFSFGLGSLVAPLIAAPYLGNHNDEESISKSMTYENMTSSRSFYTNTSDFSSHENESRIVYPFLIIGCIGLLVSLMFLIVSLISPTEEIFEKSRGVHNSTRSLKFILTLVVLNFLLVFVEAGIESGYAQMLTVYVVKGRLNLTAAVGAYMTSAFWAAFTLTRLASVIIAIKFSNLDMLVCDLVITLIGVSILLIFGASEWAIWLSTVLLGIGVASFYPAAVAWLDTYINVSNKIASVFCIGFGVGDMILPFAISCYIHYIPDVILYVISASWILWCLITIILYSILKKTPRKCDLPRPEYFDENITKNN